MEGNSYIAMTRRRLALILIFPAVVTLAQEVRLSGTTSSYMSKDRGGLVSLINSLEAREAEAIKYRDTVALILLWERDFTGLQASGKVMDSRHGLKYYASYHRVIEQVTVADSIAFSSGRNVLPKSTRLKRLSAAR